MRPTEIEGTMNHAQTAFGTEICAGAMVSGGQYLAPLRNGDVLIVFIYLPVPSQLLS
jgi:hypothetical protein